ncbi:hypothetical protein [Microbacterium sp. NIBRBAC000506063]|uniref:hypothetical protein n=1 Tax=Microbacterium sp. NIBRBAC000506063 TaxID=2734618 RepID=UPI002948BEC0|nr:hypothetical protein [Microbacterium sp. NIBRBAC000506063]
MPTPAINGTAMRGRLWGSCAHPPSFSCHAGDRRLSWSHERDDRLDRASPRPRRRGARLDRPEGDGFVVVDLLGRRRTDAVSWHRAEEILDALGIGYLADIYELRQDSGEWLRVRIAEVSASSIRVKEDDFGAVGAPQIYYALPFPVPEDALRPSGGDQTASPVAPRAEDETKRSKTSGNLRRFVSGAMRIRSTTGGPGPVVRSRVI